MVINQRVVFDSDVKVVDGADLMVVDGTVMLALAAGQVTVEGAGQTQTYQIDSCTRLFGATRTPLCDHFRRECGYRPVQRGFCQVSPKNSKETGPKAGLLFSAPICGYSSSSKHLRFAASALRLPSWISWMTWAMRSLMGVGTPVLRPHWHTTPLMASTSQGL